MENPAGPRTLATDEQKRNAGGLRLFEERAKLMRLCRPVDGSVDLMEQIPTSWKLTCDVVFHEAAESHAEVNRPGRLRAPQFH